MRKLDGLRTRLAEIDKEVSVLAKSGGYTVQETLHNPTGKPRELLEAIHGLLVEKLRIQKAIFGTEIGDLSNVVFLSERAR